MVVGIGLRRNRRTATAVINYLNQSPRNTAVGPRYERYRVSVNREVGRNGHISSHVGDSQRVGSSRITARPAGKVVVGIGLRRNRRTATAVINYLNQSPRNTAVGPRYERYRVSVNREVGRNGHISSHVGDSQRVGSSRITARPAGKVVIGIGHRCNCRTVAAVINYLNQSPRNTAVSPGYKRYRVGVYRKVGRNGDIGSYAGVGPRVGC